ncbi:hypothetical protein RHIZ_06300 [Rhizobium skierniewicense]|uniref:hypothetical protein n=1 Tax=Rhizobium skierniewicense TaxID=984260 RepID=UPI001FAB974E|nr:hypothetical protein [Rhizobium skierniewicense]MCI9865551.1 hypothetical protein [Rhizobium skierniewicense]
MTDTKTGTAIPARPKHYHNAVRETAVDAIIADVGEWMAETSQFQQKALKEVLVRCLDTNAYDYARNLEERYGWSPDARLVEILDQLSLFSAADKVVANWVAEYNVTIPFKVGDRVCASTVKAGTITELRHKTAQLSVAADEDRETAPTARRIINFEDATPILGTIGTAPAADGGAE